MSKLSTKRKDTTVMPYHIVTVGALVGGTATIDVNPTGFGGRVLIEADVWASFKVLALKFRLSRPSGTTNDQCAGFVGAVEDTPPSTVNQTSQLLPSVWLPGTNTVPSNWCTVSKQDLAGPFPWYKTIPGTADATEEKPGIIVICGVTTDSYVIEIEATFKFKTSVAAGNTPMELAARRTLRQARMNREVALSKESLLKVLNARPLVLAPCQGEVQTYTSSVSFGK